MYCTAEGGCVREGVAGCRWGSTAASAQGQERTRGPPSPRPGPGYPAQPLPCLLRAAHFFLGAKLSLPRLQRKTTGDSARPTSVFNVSAGQCPSPAASSPCVRHTRRSSQGKATETQRGTLPVPFHPILAARRDGLKRSRGNFPASGIATQGSVRGRGSRRAAAVGYRCERSQTPGGEGKRCNKLIFKESDAAGLVCGAAERPAAPTAPGLDPGRC